MDISIGNLAARMLSAAQARIGTLSAGKLTITDSLDASQASVSGIGGHIDGVPTNPFHQETVTLSTGTSPAATVILPLPVIWVAGTQIIPISTDAPEFVARGMPTGVGSDRYEIGWKQDPGQDVEVELVIVYAGAVSG